MDSLRIWICLIHHHPESTYRQTQWPNLPEKEKMLRGELYRALRQADSCTCPMRTSLQTLQQCELQWRNIPPATDRIMARVSNRRNRI